MPELTLRPNQGKVFLDNHRFIVLVAGRRWAKTTTMIVKLFAEALKRPGLYGYFAPTYGQAKLIAWEIIKSVIPAQYRIGLPNESELYIKLYNGSRIRLFGLDRPERIFGVKLAGALVDEYDQTKTNVYETFIRPALSDSMGFCWFVGNPDATKKKLKNLFDDVRINQRPEWTAFHYRSIDGGYIPKEEIELAKRDLDPRTFREQYEASFEDVLGQVYYGFSEANVTAKDPDGFTVDYKPGLPVRLFWDFNVDPFCVGAAHFIQKNADGKPYQDIHVIDEFIMRNSNTPEMCKILTQKYQNHKSGLIIYGDATGQSRDTSSSMSDYQIIHDAFKNFPGFQLKVKTSNPREKDRINSVNSKLQSYDGKRHVFIKPGLKALPKDFMNVIYKEGTTDIDKSDLQYTHISDAFGYLCNTEFPVVRSFVR